jgi:small-conductance mechanosensitive channel
METNLTEIWNFVLVTLPGGDHLTVGKIIAVIILVIGGYLVSRFLGHVLAQRLSRTLSPDVTYMIKRVTFFTLLVFVILTALHVLGVPLTAFAFATGAIAIGVGFGAQNIINNFISGWILMAERPIRIDDFVEIDGTMGVVELIGTRSTRVRRTDGVHMLVPNSRLLEQTVINWTLIDNEIRSTVRVGVAYGSPVETVAQLLLDAVIEQEEVKEKPAPKVVFEDFGDNSLVFDTYFWCDVGGERLLREIRSDIRFRISERFAANGIEIAFPQRDVHIDSREPLSVQVIQKQERAK